MTEGQYRALVAYLQFWTPQYPHLGLDQAIRDIGITATREGVVNMLWVAAWDFDEETGLITFQA